MDAVQSLFESGDDGLFWELDQEDNEHAYGWLDEVREAGLKNDEDDSHLNPVDARTEKEYEDRMAHFELDTYGVITAQKSINPSVWPQLCTGGLLGGAHSGHIMLHLHEVEIPDQDDRRRFLVDGNTQRFFSGGQIYMPFTKRIIQKNDTKKEKDIASLPAMIQHVLSVQQHLPKNPADEEKKQLVYQNIEMVVKRLCDKIRRAQNEIETSVQNNSIRYEMFLCTSKVGVQEAFQHQDYVHIPHFRKCRPGFRVPQGQHTKHKTHDSSEMEQL